MKMPQPGAVAIVLALLAPAAVQGSFELLPGAGVVKLFSWNDELVTEAAQQLPLVDSVEPLLEQENSQHADIQEDLALLSEKSGRQIRVNSDFARRQGAVTLGAGLGAGAGFKGGAQMTMADANTAAGSAAAAKLTNAATARVAGAAEAQVKTVQVHVQAQSMRGNATAIKSKQPLVTQSWFAYIRLSLSTAFVVKTLCMMCNIFYQASPLPLINQFNLKGDTGGADLAPFIAVAYGGWQWCFYGLFAYIVTSKNGFLVLVYSNVVGATLGLYYVYAFTLNCNNVAMLQRSRKYYYVLACIAAVQFCAIETMPSVKALFFCGLISSAWSVVSSASLVATIPEVYEKRSCQSLPLPMLVMNEISAFLWIVCGVMLWDPWITFPNCFALIVCSFALHLCWKFPADGSVCDENDIDEDIIASAAAKQAELDDASREFQGARSSPSLLQRGLDYVSRSSASERDALHDPAEAAKVYGGTGGTGDW
jgi:uncharacterized protein with PQ loop repeat